VVRVAAVRLEGHLKVVDTLARIGFRDALQAETRTLVQLSREEPVTVTTVRR
jgi:hypothetical protein